MQLTKELKSSLRREYSLCLNAVAFYRNALKDFEKKYNLSTNVFLKRFEEIRNRFSDVEILKDNAKDAPNKFKKGIFYVKLKNPKTNSISDRYEIINEKSTLIKSLRDDINRLRIYCAREHFEKIKEFSDNLVWKP